MTTESSLEREFSLHVYRSPEFFLLRPLVLPRNLRGFKTPIAMSVCSASMVAITCYKGLDVYNSSITALLISQACSHCGSWSSLLRRVSNGAGLNTNESPETAKIPKGPSEQDIRVMTKRTGCVAHSSSDHDLVVAIFWQSSGYVKRTRLVADGPSYRHGREMW